MKSQKDNILVDLIGNFLKSSLLEDAVSFFTSIEKLIENKPCLKSIEQMANIYTNACDNLKLEGIHKDKLEFISGIFDVIQRDNSNFYCQANLYFKNNMGNWVIKSAISSDLLFEKHLTSAAINELKKSKKISIEVI